MFFMVLGVLGSCVQVRGAYEIIYRSSVNNPNEGRVCFLDVKLLPASEANRFNSAMSEFWGAQGGGRLICWDHFTKQWIHGDVTVTIEQIGDIIKTRQSMLDANGQDLFDKVKKAYDDSEVYTYDRVESKIVKTQFRSTGGVAAFSFLIGLIVGAVFIAVIASFIYSYLLKNAMNRSARSREEEGGY